MFDFEPHSVSLTNTNAMRVTSADSHNACWAILTVMGANGVYCTTPSPGSCIQLKLPGMEPLCTSLVYGEYPVWNDSFPIFTDGLIELTIELHRSLPGNESLVAQVQGTVDMQANDGQDMTWQLKHIKYDMKVPVIFRVEAQELIFDEPALDEIVDDVIQFLPDALCLSDITLRLSPEGPNDLLSGSRLFVYLLIDDAAFDRTLPVTREVKESAWNCDGALSVPTGIPFTLEVCTKGYGQEQDKTIASVTITGETILSARTGNDKFTRILDNIDVSYASLEIAFMVDDLNLDENAPASQNSMSSNLSSSTTRMESRPFFPAPRQDSGRRGKLLSRPGATKVVSTPLTHITSDGSRHSSDSPRIAKTSAFDVKEFTKSCLEHADRTLVDTMYEIVTAFSDDNPSKCIALNALGGLFFQRFSTVNHLPDLNKAITCHELATTLTTDEHSGQVELFADWGIALLRRAELYDNQIDADNAIFALQASVALTAENDFELPQRLIHLGDAFESRFNSRGNMDDLEEAIAAKDKALMLPSTDASNLPRDLFGLGKSLFLRYKLLRDPSDLERMIFCNQSAADIIPDSQVLMKGRFYGIAGSLLLVAFQHSGNVDHLHQGVSTLKKALPLVEGDLDAKASCLVSLANALKLRFDHYFEIVDLNEAVSLQESATSSTFHPSTLFRYSKTLGELYKQKYDLTQDTQYLDNALQTTETAVALVPLTDSRRFDQMSRLAQLHATRFDETGVISDLDIAIQNQKEAIAATSDGDPKKLLRLMDLGNVYQNRFERLGNVADIEQSILALEQADRLAEQVDPFTRARVLSHLGSALKRSGERTNQTADLLKGGLCAEQSHTLAPDLVPESDDLCDALQDARNAPTNPALLETAFQKLQRVVRSVKARGFADPLLSSCLGSILALKSSITGDRVGLDRAIELTEAADQEVPDNHPKKAESLDNTAIAYAKRFEHLGIPDDENKAVSIRRRVVALLSNDDPRKAESLFLLASLLLASPRICSDPMLKLEPVLLLSFAAQSPVGWPVIRLKSAQRWAEAAEEMGPRHAFLAFEQAIALLPRVAWRGLSVADRHLLIADAGTIVSEATACAIECAQHETAVEWMEQGRSIVWGQLLQLRSPITELEEREPGLAAQLQEVSRNMEAANSSQNESRDYRRLALDWDTLLENVRSLPSLESFMRPKSISHLSSAARSGPIIILTAGDGIGSALVLMGGPDPIVHISLPGLSRETAEGLHAILNHLRSTTSIPRSRSDRGFIFPRKGKDNPEDNVKAMLCQLWDLVVRPIVEVLALPCVSDADELPHIWWCPTGSLAFLPIHAAGNYDSDEPGTKLSDYVVSSYTPTLTALLEKPEVKKHNEFKLLAVGQAATPGQDALPNTTKELDAIQARAGQLTVERLDGEDATVERVLEGMKECGWVHLACHGTQNPDDPTKSALILADCDLELSTIINQNLPHAEFAFLSACQTATGDVKLQEEAVHFAAGMLLAGYRSVIATSWSILDRDGPFVADEVYRELFKDGRPDRSRAAWALHKAVQKLRLSGASFARWIPFIHLGE